MFKTISKFAAVALAGVLLVGCGERVEVPPAHVGKVLGQDGYQEGLIPTSKLRLPVCLNYCDRMVVMDIGDKSYIEPMTIFIPRDKLKVDVDVRATLSVDPNKTEALFNKLEHVPQTDQFSKIEAASIYNTYGKQVLQAEVRAYLTQYSIAEISSNSEKINADIQVLLEKVMRERTPFTVRYAGLTNIKYPPIITTAQENAAKRREAIAQEEAEGRVSQVRQERELKEAQLQREIEKEKAETKAIEQRTIAAAIDQRALEYYKAETDRIKAERWDGKLPTTTAGDAPLFLNVK